MSADGSWPDVLPQSRRARYRGSGQAGVPVDRRPGAADRLPPPRRPETRAERLRGWAYVLVWGLLRRLPEPVAFTLADLAGRASHRRGGDVREQVRANLSRVVPAAELNATVLEAYRSYARYWCEAFRAADLDPADLDRRTTTDGFVHLDGALEQGRGVVVLLAHHGSWDVAARWAETHGYHLAVVAEVLRPRRVFKQFVRLRERIGLEIVPLGRHRYERGGGGEGERPDRGDGRRGSLDRDRPERGDRGAGRLGQVLAENHLVGLLTDRDLSGSAPVVSFFGERCRIPVGPAVLSRRQQAPIVPITMLQRPGRRWHLQVLPAIDAGALTLTEAHQAVADALENLIRLEPAQWHAFQPMFLADVEGGAASETDGRR